MKRVRRLMQGMGGVNYYPVSGRRDAMLAVVLSDELDALERELEAWVNGERDSDASKKRQGLDKLLALFPGADVVGLDDNGPWTRVRLWPASRRIDRMAITPDEYAIWNNTGNVYRVESGAAEDDPFLVVTPL